MQNNNQQKKEQIQKFISDKKNTLEKKIAEDKARLGNLGDVKALTDGVYEMREKFGPGWRMYYVVRGKAIIVMLGGGDKSSQSSDIKAAKKLAKLLED
jgi:putative addiction module killer protein